MLRTPCVPLLALAALLPAQDDPVAAFRARLDGALRQHPFFAKVDFTIDASRPPYLFYIQRPAKDDPEYVLKMINSYLPFIDELRSVFDKEYAGPLSLQRSADAPCFAIAILASAGSYADFSKAVGDRALHWARAHYDPALRLSITYQDAFAPRSTAAEERQAILHEFMHALQHAYSGNGAMPKAAWFNEGLANYRASCTHIASSLRDPPVREQPLATMAGICGRKGLRWLVAPVAELVEAGSYQEVVEQAGRRLGADVQTGHALGAFYAQSELFARFLHEGMNGKYRAGFQRYFAAQMRGEHGAEVFAAALGDGRPIDLAQVESDWLTWLTAELRARHGANYPDLARAAEVKASVPIPMPPPRDFDPATLAWAPEDRLERIAACRRLCSRGEYDAGLQLLPDAAGENDEEAQRVLRRERELILAVIGLRDAILADYAQKATVLTVKTRFGDVKGKLVRREDPDLILQVGGKEQAVPLAELRPDWLIREGSKQKRFEGQERWLEVWVRWLGGAKMSTLQVYLKLDQPRMAQLRRELTAEIDTQIGAAAEALVDLQRTALGPGVAFGAELARVEALAGRFREHPLFTARAEAIEMLVRALAERAFSLADPAAIGVHGKVERLPDGRAKVRYPGPAKGSGADFAVQADNEDDKSLAVGKLSYDGPTELADGGDGMRLIGSGVLRWAVPLRGRQEIELAFEATGATLFSLVVCADADNGLILVDPNGTVAILDRKSGIADHVGTPGEIYLQQTHRLRVVHDGEKRLEVFLDGKRTAELANVGARVRGDLGLFIHSSNALKVHELVIIGVLDPTDPLPLRDRFVQAAVDRIWP